MPKRFIRLIFEKKVIAICPVEETNSAVDYLKLENEAFQNYLQLYKKIKETEKRIDELEKEVKHLKGED